MRLADRNTEPYNLLLPFLSEHISQICMSRVNYKKTWGEESGDLAHVVHEASQEMHQATGNLDRKTKLRDTKP